MEKSIPIYKLAEKANMKASDFLVGLMEKGYRYKSINSKVATGAVEEILKEFGVKPEKAKEIIQPALVENNTTMVGMFYNPETRKYSVAKVILSPEQFREAKGELIGEHRTVYHAKIHFHAETERSGILRPNKLEG